LNSKGQYVEDTGKIAQKKKFEDAIEKASVKMVLDAGASAGSTAASAPPASAPVPATPTALSAAQRSQADRNKVFLRETLSGVSFLV
jgi:hypothetical protein